jgi:hypothetical protein
MPRDLRIINNTIYAGVFTVISKNAMSRKVLVRKVLGFKCVQVTPLTFLGTHLVAHWKMLFTLFRYWFVIFLGLLRGHL